MSAAPAHRAGRRRAAAAPARIRRAAALALPEARLAGPGRLAVGAATALAIAVAGALLADAGEWRIRWPGISAAALAAAAAGLLADPARAVATATPSPLPLRRALRLAVGLGVLTASWAAVLALSTTGALAADPPYGAAERGGLTLQAGALVLIALGLEAVLARRGFEERARLAAMAAPAVLLVTAALLPADLALLVPPGDPGWDAAENRWALVAAGGAAALGWASRRE